MLMCVKGHDEVAGNEEADRRAKREVELGWRMLRPDIVTPVGIRQARLLHPKAPAHMRWSTKPIKGLVDMVTDKGSQRQWLWEIGKVEDPQCVCDEWTAQNAAHLQQCPWMGDGRGRQRSRCGKMRSGVRRWRSSSCRRRW